MDTELREARPRTARARHGVASLFAQMHRGRLLAGAAVAVTVALHAAAAASARVPLWSDDEIGPLATARLIAGVGEPLTLNHLSYYPGWAVVVAPLWWVSGDPGSVYRLAVALAAISACLTIIPLAAIARRAGASGPVAVVLASVVMAAPSRVVMSDYAVIEAFFALVVVVTAWLGMRFADGPTTGRGLAVALVASYAMFTHGRGVVLPIAVGLMFLAGFRPGSRRRTVLLLLVLVVSSAALFAVHKGLSGALYEGGLDREDASVETVRNALSGPLLRGLVGQAWYALVAWLLLPAFGVALLARAARREVGAERRAGAATWWTVVLVGALATSTLAATNLMTGHPPRFDAQMYGRYLDPFLLPLVLVALVGIARGLRRRTALLAWASASVVLALFVLVAVPRGERGGAWFHLNIAGLLLWDWPPSLSHAAAPFGLASLVAAGAGALVILGGRRAPWLPIGVIGALFVASTLHAQSEVVRPTTERAGYVPGVVETVDRVDAVLGEQVPVVYLSAGASYTGQNLTQFWLVPRSVEVVAQATAVGPGELVVGRRSWPQGSAIGARRLSGETDGNEALWVLPGPLAGRLDRLGYLEPAPSVGAPAATSASG